MQQLRQPEWPVGSKGPSAHTMHIIICVAKGSESRSKMIQREKIEGEFEALRTQLTPPPVLIKTTTKMFKTWWDYRQAQIEQREQFQED